MSVFITGASSGIGEACARVFAAAGHDLVLVARREDRLKTIRTSIENSYAVSVSTFQLDIRDRHALELLDQKNSALFDTVDILINNAGLAKGLNPLQQGKPEDWEVTLDTNIKGLLYVTHTFLPRFLTKKQGHIVNMGSVAGHWVYEKGNVYCASKFAVKAINEGLRLDLHGTGIRVTAVSPGLVETEFSEVRFGDKERAKAVYQGKKTLTPLDIAETVLWCVQRPAHVNIQEIILFPTEQASVHVHLPQITH